MKWENLKENKCPYCGDVLIFDWDKEIECTACRFHIDPVRLKSMVENNRARPRKTEPYKMKWQFLKLGRCPRCGDDLMASNNGPYDVEVCIKNPECTFKIRHDKMLAILADPMHAAHQFQIE